jgi:hypothetical protein
MTKDVVENRARISVLCKLKLLGIIVRENGLDWSLFIGMYYVASSISEAIKATTVSSAARRIADYSYGKGGIAVLLQ